MSDETRTVQHSEGKQVALPYTLGKIAASFDLATAEGKKALHHSIHGDKSTLKACVGQAFLIQHVAIMPRETTKETGEVDEWREIVMIGPDGKSFSSGSPYVAASIADMVTLFGELPWNPPIAVKVCRRLTSAKNEMLYLELA